MSEPGNSIIASRADVGGAPEGADDGLVEPGTNKAGGAGTVGIMGATGIMPLC